MEHLVGAMVAVERKGAEALNRRERPVMVKLSPDFENRRDLSDTIEGAIQGGAKALIVGNTSTSRLEVEGHPRAKETGGLSGHPRFKHTLNFIKDVQTFQR